MPYSHITPDGFSEKFKASRNGKELEEELSKPCDRSKVQKDALASSIYSLPKWELFKTCLNREFLLMKRNSFVYMFKITQVITCLNKSLHFIKMDFIGPKSQISCCLPPGRNYCAYSNDCLP